MEDNVLTSFFRVDCQDPVLHCVGDCSVFPDQVFFAPKINGVSNLNIPYSPPFLLFLKKLPPFMVVVQLALLAGEQVAIKEGLYYLGGGKVVAGLVGVTNSAGETMTGKILGAGKAKWVPALGQDGG